jgi:hypothetical protein
METKKIYAAISNIMGKVGVVGKDKKNEQQGYKFRGIDDMYNALNKHLAEEKVFATSSVLDMKREERLSQKGATLLYTILTIKFTFFAEDGSSVESVTVGEAMDSGDKSCNKAMSTAYKYALMQIFCIPTLEEKDTEVQTHEIAPKVVATSLVAPLVTPPTLTPYETAIKYVDEANGIEALQELQLKLTKSKALTDDEKKKLVDIIITKSQTFDPIN